MWSVTATEVTTVIASLAFHPSERLLVIATNSTLYFWDWNFPNPFTKCSTANEKQKLRQVFILFFYNFFLLCVILTSFSCLDMWVLILWATGCWLEFPMLLELRLIFLRPQLQHQWVQSNTRIFIRHSIFRDDLSFERIGVHVIISQFAFLSFALSEAKSIYIVVNTGNMVL